MGEVLEVVLEHLLPEVSEVLAEVSEEGLEVVLERLLPVVLEVVLEVSEVLLQEVCLVVLQEVLHNQRLNLERRTRKNSDAPQLVYQQAIEERARTRGKQKELRIKRTSKEDPYIHLTSLNQVQTVTFLIL